MTSKEAIRKQCPKCKRLVRIGFTEHGENRDNMMVPCSGGGMLVEESLDKTSRATWTTEYPTQPGFYWLRNYVMKNWIGPDRKKPALEPTLVRVYPMLDSFLIGNECSHQREEYVSAEWYGPIQPPE